MLSLTGSYGAFGVPISKAAQLAVEQVNEARGDIGCEIVYDVRDSQTQASVAVDSARKLIDLDGVTALVGPISSGITAPLLTSVTVEEDVLVIATASTSVHIHEYGRGTAKRKGCSSARCRPTRCRPLRPPKWHGTPVFGSLPSFTSTTIGA